MIKYRQAYHVKCEKCPELTSHRSSLCAEHRKRTCPDCKKVYRPVNMIYSRCTPCREKLAREL
jgi:hypothetical protein